ncbi:MAG: right-handed parallel beta-helix repeat-containing protein [Candidatus Bathyarchaeota archaeon]|nr:MAG: right-handed parallel beta-helix repeat-containing protein [Candidatus Bathyarchaeota archaeon]
MKKWFKLVSLLALIIAGAFTFAGGSLLPATNATYVEGYITRDTTWTLMDSPFVVSKRVVVRPGVTLTIEPGVEVRFGGDFQILVEGRLQACGEENNTIIFTSNRDQPVAGDWNTTSFTGTELSTLEYCVLQYAKHAITVDSSRVTIENCEISNNLESGISITGDNQLTIRDNEIGQNRDGVVLTEDSTTGVNIEDNTIMSNSESGIRLAADNYADLVITNNILSANNNGFLVSGEASTHITRNSISYNTVGIFYRSGTNHVAEDNDIYGNMLGMDVSTGATVDAEYNYWGHASGPYHESLNPAGEGDPVGGGGADLDFIFWLTAPISHINKRPTARLYTDKTLVSPNQTVTFIATTSSDEGRVDKYRFNFGDGETSGWTTLSILTHQYSSLGSYNASVTVMDDFSVWSNNEARATIDVQNLEPTEVSIAPNHFRVFSEGEVPLTVQVTYGNNTVEDASVNLFAIRSGNLTSSSGLTNSTGHFTTTFVAPNVTRITHVRITATASKSGYAQGSDYMYVTVLPSVLVDLTADPVLIETETTSEVTAYVTYNGQPVAETFVTIRSDGGGNFSATTGTTDSNGRCTFIFTAPKTMTQLNITLTAIATKVGYFEGIGQKEIIVAPKVFIVEVIAVPTTISSEETSSLTVYVIRNAVPISEVNITMSAEFGSFSPENGVTDSNGEATFTFTAPQTLTQLNFSITATATKTEYADSEDQVEMTVNPGTLGVYITALPFTVESRDEVTIIVHVAYNVQPIEDVLVTIWSEGGGDFSQNEAMTNSDGEATFTFIAPEVNMESSVAIIATAAKSGYVNGENLIIVTVNPAHGIMGLPPTTILIIVVIIVVIVIVLILLKMKIIYISRE